MAAILGGTLGFLAGLVAGACIATRWVGEGFLEGQWTRAEMRTLLRKWKGPNGERWSD